MTSFHRRIAEQVSQDLGSADGTKDIDQLNNALRLLAKWRSSLLQSAWLKHEGRHVKSGPFTGMLLTEQSGEGCHIAKLMGIYEQPLWPVIETLVERNYPLVLNVGAAEGFYAIGLARRMPESRVLAYETSPAARQILAALIEANGVSERVQPHATLTSSELSQFDGRRMLVICDIEGGEVDLFSGDAPLWLRNSDLIIETHGGVRRGAAEELTDLFGPTHHATLVEDDGTRSFDAPSWLRKLSHLDQLLCTWEWRSAPTPWLILTARSWEQ